MRLEALQKKLSKYYSSTKKVAGRSTKTELRKK
jgi:hypothetical protein